jgi:DNA primase small subunit (EC 2.7.7.-)
VHERTLAYLRGRFGDHYRRVDPAGPPDAHDREWGYVPWTSGPGETYARHNALLDLGDLSAFLARERPNMFTFPPAGTTTPARRRWTERAGNRRT